MFSALLIEDDLRLAALTRTYLERHELEVTHVTRGKMGLELLLGVSFDIVLLDLMLPDMDGMEICRRIRERSDVPIIMLTARGEEADRVMGLELGADDYLPKPFSPRELLARIRATVRRARREVGPEKATLEVGALRLDPSARLAQLKNEVLDLTGYEFDLLYALASRRGQVLSREQLMSLARGASDEAFDRSIDVHVSRLRKKLGDPPKKPRYIKTLRGLGYQFIGE